ncbi:MAG: hypothetical protein RLZZ450_4951 [Pseudomonadota bacterium]|jgi:glutathione-regulated potassium-efflux system protein KefB
MICICVDKKESANHMVTLCRQSFPLAQLYVRAFDRVHALELLELGAHFQQRETFESALTFGRAALEELGVSPERVAEVEEDVRRRDADRLAAQQQARDPWAGSDHLYVRPAPRPEPFTRPVREAAVLNPEELAAEQAQSA